MNPDALTGKRILVTGVTGWVAGPLAASLAAAGNTVYGAARFPDPDKRAPFEAAGVRTVSLDLADSRFDEVPAVDLVLHFAVLKTDDYALSFAANAHGSADLMTAANDVAGGIEAFFHCSSTAVYAPAGLTPLTETSPLGDSHGMMHGMRTYSIAKIGAEVCVAHEAKRLGVPTVIARLNVPYGDTYGWPLFHLMMMERSIPIPVPLEVPSGYNPIHADDICASIPFLLGLASASAPRVNWGGPDVVAVQDWCEEMGRLTGLTPAYNPTAATIQSVVVDTSRFQQTGFVPSVPWREGFRRLVATSRPDLLQG